MVVPSPTIDPKETELPEKFGSREGGKLPLSPPSGGIRTTTTTPEPVCELLFGETLIPVT